MRLALWAKKHEAYSEVEKRSLHSMLLRIPGFLVRKRSSEAWKFVVGEVAGNVGILWRGVESHHFERETTWVPDTDNPSGAVQWQ
eukprot:2059483-Amphidinium_carterae.1